VNVSPSPPVLRNVLPPSAANPKFARQFVRAAVAQPVLGHRGPESRSVLAACGAALRRIFRHTARRVAVRLVGTGAMEAALANVLEPCSDVLVLSNGQFGERFA
jgi:aspartate aminotransferase-like enzyme